MIKNKDYHDVAKRIGSTRPAHEHADTKWDWQAIMAVVGIMIVIAVFRYIS